MRYLCREMKNKPTTANDYQRRIDLVIEYIRLHLADDIDLCMLADLSAFSPYHFHRIVSALPGESIGEFIARTRIATAAQLLCPKIPKGPVAEGDIGVKTVAGGKYAVFLYTGPYTGLGAAYAKIYGEWLPASGCCLRESPCFEKYRNNPDRVPVEKLKTEISVSLV